MPPFKIDAIDHFVLTVADVDATCLFYERVLGLKPVSFNGRKGLSIGRQKINLHPAGSEFPERASVPTPGAADFCLLTKTPIEQVMKHLALHGVLIEVGPVDKVGAKAGLRSIYFRDLDGNLVEVANEVGRTAIKKGFTLTAGAASEQSEIGVPFGRAGGGASS